MSSPTLAVLNDSAVQFAALKDIALWSVDDENRYRFFAYVFLFAFAALALAGFVSKRIDRVLAGRLVTVGLFALVTLALFGGRWPTLFVKDTLFADESQALAQAITALVAPIPWIGFDGNTCGPLETFLLDIPAVFGLPLTFFSTRIIGILCDAGALACLYATLSTLVSPRIARIALIGPIGFFANMFGGDLTACAGETLPLLLASLATACVAWLSKSKRPLPLAFAIGAIVGAMPLAKLQSIVIAAAIAVVAMGVAYRRAMDVRSRVGSFAVVVAGALVVPVIILGWVTLAGGFYDFWMSYILSSLAYMHDPVSASFVLGNPQFSPFFDFSLVVVAFGAVTIVLVRPLHPTRTQVAYLASLLVLGAAIYAVFAPGRPTENYLLFLVTPVAVALGLSLGVVLEAFAERLPLRYMATEFVLLALVFAPNGSLYHTQGSLGSIPDFFYAAKDDVVATIQQYAEPGERVAVWGWRPHYNVLTRTPTGTRDSINGYQDYTPNNPYYDYYRKRYIHDLDTIRPKLLVDAGIESFGKPIEEPVGHEDVPEIANYVRANYHLVRTVGQFFFYLRNS